MHQLAIFPVGKTRSPLRIFQIIFTVLALLSFALGSVLLSLTWLGVGVTTTGKDYGMQIGEGRGLGFLLLWPATMLAVWIFSTLALLLAKRWRLAALSFPLALLFFQAIWTLTNVFLWSISGVMFTVLFILLNTGAIWLARWFLTKPVQGNV